MLVIIDYDFILWVLRIGHRSISPFPQAQQDLLSNLVHVSIHGVKIYVMEANLRFLLVPQPILQKKARRYCN